MLRVPAVLLIDRVYISNIILPQYWQLTLIKHDQVVLGNPLGLKIIYLGTAHPLLFGIHDLLLLLLF